MSTPTTNNNSNNKSTTNSGINTERSSAPSELTKRVITVAQRKERRQLLTDQQINLLSSASSGMVVCALFHPLELVELRLQVQQGNKYKGMLHACSTILREEGIRSLYRGLLPNLIQAGLMWGAFITTYEFVKSRFMHVQRLDPTALPVSPVDWEEELDFEPFLHPESGIETHAGAISNNNKNVVISNTTRQPPATLQPQHSSPMVHLAAGVCAGTVGCFIHNPLQVVKVRMCTHPTGITLREAISSIARSPGGLASFYKGIGPSLLGVSDGAIQFTVYERLKVMLLASAHGGTLTSSHIMFASVASKAVAGVLTYPYQVVRSRLQAITPPPPTTPTSTTTAQLQAQQYNGMVDCVRKTVQREGWPALYKGIAPNLTRNLPPAGMFLTIHEYLKLALKQLTTEADRGGVNRK